MLIAKLQFYLGHRGIAMHCAIMSCTETAVFRHNAFRDISILTLIQLPVLIAVIFLHKS